MTTKDALHQLVDALDDPGAQALLRYARALVADPVLRTLETAPEDDEELTEEELASVAQAEEDFHAGRRITLEALERKLGQ